MSPYKIEMIVDSYTEDKEPLYKVRVYDKDGNIVLISNDNSKERAVKIIAQYCCVVL